MVIANLVSSTLESVHSSWFKFEGDKEHLVVRLETCRVVLVQKIPWGLRLHYRGALSTQLDGFTRILNNLVTNRYSKAKSLEHLGFLSLLLALRKPVHHFHSNSQLTQIKSPSVSEARAAPAAPFARA